MQNKKNKLNKFEVTKEELAVIKEREKRAVADYQNLVRRQQQQKLEIIKFSVGELITDLVQPLNHLSLAAQQLNDQGLNMVISQVWEVLQNHGLQEISPNVGDKFDLEIMEVVDKEGPSTSVGMTGKVAKLVSKGYRLNGKVIRHAKVIVK